MLRLACPTVSIGSGQDLLILTLYPIVLIFLVHGLCPAVNRASRKVTASISMHIASQAFSVPRKSTMPSFIALRNWAPARPSSPPPFIACSKPVAIATSANS